MITEPNLQKAFSLLKDKGSVLGLTHSLLEERNRLQLEMESIAQSFKTTFTPPWTVYLSAQSKARGSVYLRWRNSGRATKQSYFDLFDSERGNEILKKQSSQVLALFVSFEEKRLELNLAHSLATHAWVRLRQHEHNCLSVTKYKDVLTNNNKRSTN